MNRSRFIILCLLILFPVSPASAQIVQGDWARKLFARFPFLCAPDTVSVVFIGDVMMHARQIDSDYGPFLSKLSPRFQKADLAVANMEFTLAGEPYSGYPAFSAPDHYAEYIYNQGIDLFLTANNHILDKGSAGLERTLSVYKKMEAEGKIRFTGTADTPARDTTCYPLILNIKGIRLAFINFTYGTNAGGSREWPKVNRMKKSSILPALERAERRKADYIIALPHWGEEYQLHHSESQEEMARWLAENGVDVIIGAHPHVIQDYDVLQVKDKNGKERKVPVFYSIGNAVSNMSAENTRLELMVELKFTRDVENETGFLEPEAEYMWCTLPGRLTGSYCTIFVKDYLGKRGQWKTASDYDNMISTYQRIRKSSGIEDN